MESLLNQVFIHVFLSLLDVIEYHIAADDKIIIMGSDGVWEFISNEDAIQIVGPYYENRDINGACEALMKEAYS